jgi:hypothetical protein
MEIDITRFFEETEPFEFSRSVAEWGADAGPTSWRNALAEGARAPLLSKPEELAALRNWARKTGAWECPEVDTWSTDECNALFIQLVSGDMREGGLDSDPDDSNWKEYERGAEEGRWSGNIFRSGNKIYYSLDR